MTFRPSGELGANSHQSTEGLRTQILPYKLAPVHVDLPYWSLINYTVCQTALLTGGIQPTAAVRCECQICVRDGLLLFGKEVVTTLHILSNEQALNCTSPVTRAAETTRRVTWLIEYSQKRLPRHIGPSLGTFPAKSNKAGERYRSPVPGCKKVLKSGQHSFHFPRAGQTPPMGIWDSASIKSYHSHRSDIITSRGFKLLDHSFTYRVDS